MMKTAAAYIRVSTDGQVAEDKFDLDAQREFSCIIVPRVDRLSRDLFLQLSIEKEFLSQGVEIISATEPFTGRDPMTVAFRQMAGVFAELEKHRIKDRMSGERKQKAKQGG